MDLAALVATTLITKCSDALVAGGTSAVRALLALVRKRLRHDTGVLAGALAYPDDDDRRVRLVEALAEAMQRDPGFAEELRVQWRAASVELQADRGGVVNQFSGQASKVVQARDIHGDLSL